MSETPETTEQGGALSGAEHERQMTEEPTGATETSTPTSGETNTETAPAPAFGLGSGPVSGDGPDEDAPRYELNGEDYSDLPTETRAELHRNAGRTLSTDSAGVDRVVSQHVTDWEPAPVEPDPDVVAHTERVSAALDAAREERANRLGLQRDAAAAQGEAVSSGQEA